MKNKWKVFIMSFVCILLPILSFGIGSAAISMQQIIEIFLNKIGNVPLPENFDSNVVAIFWSIRLPRVLVAFLVGAMLSVSGTLMQSVLQNPLASGYTLGVSAGASLGVALVIVTGFSFPFFVFLTKPFVGFLFGVSTVMLVLFLSSKLDLSLKNHTVILMGMVVSLFVNSLLTFVSALHKNNIKELLIWQMGSFSSKTWNEVFILLIIAVVGIFIALLQVRELDILSFGEDQASSLGIHVKRKKRNMIILGAFLTGTSVCFTGIIGFIDLIAPHVVRKIFGSSHRYVVPMSVLFGGAFMVVADTVARTVIAPIELPIGAITAFIGAPFFALIYLKGRK